MSYGEDQKMRIDQVIYFLETVRSGSFTKAAEKLHMQQPSLRESIINLENELGFELLTRSRKGVTLNEYGLKALPYFQAIRQMYDNICQIPYQVDADDQDTLIIEAQSNYNYCTILFHNMFTNQFPKKLLLINSSNDLESILCHLIQGKCDMGFVALADDYEKKNFWNSVTANSLQCTLLKRYLVEPVVHKNHPLVRETLVREKCKKLRIADLYKYPLIFQSSYSPIEAFLKPKLNLEKCQVMKVDNRKLSEYYCIKTEAIMFLPKTVTLDDDYIYISLDENIELSFFVLLRKDEMNEYMLQIIELMKISIDSMSI